MEVRIETLAEKKLVGNRMVMSLAQNKTYELWKKFMPRRMEIKNSVGNELFSLQVFSNSYSDVFNPNTEFEKWASAEVSDFDSIPDGMETFVLPSGLYSVFIYRGSSKDTRIFQYIYNDWLPNSVYKLDNRPHFEILGEKY